jgi:hypothetical protein
LVDLSSRAAVVCGLTRDRPDERVQVVIRIMVANLTVAVVAGIAASSGSAANPLPLSARLIQAADFAGYAPEPAPKEYRSARSWTSLDTSLIPSRVSADVARLHREGFKEVLVEYLDRAPGKQNGVSWVMQLGSAAAARAELAASLAEDKAQNPGTFSGYSVPGIAAARGYRVSGNGFIGENVLFADGPFLYLVGEGWTVGQKHAPSRAQLVAAITKLYKRVHAHPALMG